MSTEQTPRVIHVKDGPSRDGYIFEYGDPNTSHDILHRLKKQDADGSWRYGAWATYRCVSILDGYVAASGYYGHNESVMTLAEFVQYHQYPGDNWNAHEVIPLETDE